MHPHFLYSLTFSSPPCLSPFHTLPQVHFYTLITATISRLLPITFDRLPDTIKCFVRHIRRSGHSIGYAMSWGWGRRELSENCTAHHVTQSPRRTLEPFSREPFSPTLARRGFLHIIWNTIRSAFWAFTGSMWVCFKGAWSVRRTIRQRKLPPYCALWGLLRRTRCGFCTNAHCTRFVLRLFFRTMHFFSIDQFPCTRSRPIQCRKPVKWGLDAFTPKDELPRSRDAF